MSRGGVALAVLNPRYVSPDCHMDGRLTFETMAVYIIGHV
jgi:hypothetical protein